MNKSCKDSGRRRKNGLSYKFNPFTNEYIFYSNQNKKIHKNNEFYVELQNTISTIYKNSIYFLEFGNRFKIPRKFLGLVMKYLEKQLKHLKLDKYSGFELLKGIRLFLNIDNRK